MGRKISVHNLNLAKEFESGNYGIDEFCNLHGIKKHQLYYWRKKIRNTSQPASSSFIPLSINSDQSPSVAIELELQNGTRIKFNQLVPINYLKEILR